MDKVTLGAGIVARLLGEETLDVSFEDAHHLLEMLRADLRYDAKISASLSGPIHDELQIARRSLNLRQKTQLVEKIARFVGELEEMSDEHYKPIRATR